VYKLEMSTFPFCAGKGRKVHFVEIAIGILDHIVSVAIDRRGTKSGSPTAANKGPVVIHQGGFVHIGPAEVGIGRYPIGYGDLVYAYPAEGIVDHIIRMAQ